MVKLNQLQKVALGFVVVIPAGVLLFFKGLDAVDRQRRDHFNKRRLEAHLLEEKNNK